MNALPKVLVATFAKSSWLIKRHRNQILAAPFLSLQRAASSTVAEKLKLDAKICERPTKRATVARRCEATSATPSTAAKSALFADKDEI